MANVCIIIPLYRSQIDAHEQMALARAFEILQHYPATIIKPTSLDISAIAQQYPHAEIENFNDEYFNCGVHGYNRLMLSPSFYERFLSYEYMLIYQLDAWVFRDELAHWCSRGYDYIGAPWVIKPKYELLPYRVFIKIKSAFYKLINKVFDHELLANKVGNGGFSLRKVESFYRATVEKQDTIAYYLKKSRKHAVFSEDVFWAVENPQFHYPTFAEALRFSFDRNPEVYMHLNGGQLPFGCHGWTKAWNIGFWREIITGDN